jgi:GT2 family glycosyltransferase
MLLSVIIVNWKVRQLLERCLDSVFSHLEGREFEVIVIDNASDDGSLEMVRQKFPQARLIVNSENRGFAKACNQGIAISRGKHLFFLNPDSELTPGTFERIVDFMESHPDVGIGGCYLYYPDGRSQISFYRFTTLTNALGRAWLLHFLLPRNRLTAPFFSDYVSSQRPPERVCGGAMVVRREVVEQVGGFDESFFLYSEDEDLCRRAAGKGWGIASIPHTRVIHHHDQSGKKNVRQAMYSSYRSQFLLYRKYHPLYRTVFLRLIQFTGLAIRSLYWFGNAQVNADQQDAHQRFLGYWSLLLSDFGYGRSLANQKAL